MGQEGHFTFNCPTAGCGHSYRATPALVGKLMVCKSCHQKIRIPMSSAVAAHAASISRKPARSTPAAPRAAEQQTVAAHSEETVQCPGCRAACTIRPEWR